MIAVLQTLERGRVYFARDVLAQRGIASSIRGESLLGLRGALPITETALVLEVVDEATAERARAILDEHESAADLGPPWTCGRCGEPSPGTFDVCWKCGGTRVANELGTPYRPQAVVEEQRAVTTQSWGPTWRKLLVLAAFAGLGWVVLTALQR